MQNYEKNLIYANKSEIFMEILENSERCAIPEREPEADLATKMSPKYKIICIYEIFVVSLHVF